MVVCFGVAATFGGTAPPLGGGGGALPIMDYAGKLRPKGPDPFQAGNISKGRDFTTVEV